jgi:hypothetical protein
MLYIVNGKTVIIGLGHGGADHEISVQHGVPGERGFKDLGCRLTVRIS